MGRKKEEEKTCDSCILCVHTYNGCECSLSDNAVDESQTACIDYIGEDE